jgi:hypothetical protein
MPRRTWPLHALVIGAPLLIPACLFPDYRVVEEQPGSTGGSAATGGSQPSGGTTTGGTGPGGNGNAGGNGAGGTGAAGGGMAAAGGTGAAGSGGVAGGGTGGDTGGASACDGPCPVDDCSGDLAIACAREDCRADSRCSGMCSTAHILSCGDSLVDQRTDGPGSTDRIGPPPYSCVAGTYDGPERAHRLDVDPGQYVIVQAYDLDTDAALFLVDVLESTDCRADFACSAFSDAPGTSAELVTFTSQGGRSIHAIVDSASASVGYSLAVRCSPASGCRAARGIEAGQSIDASNALGSANVTQVLSLYSCSGANHLGPEAAYLFTPSATGTYRVDLTNLTGNLSLFIVAGTCGTTCLSPTSYSVSATTQPESVTFEATAHESYYIVIDSFNTTPTGYTLSVTAL